MTHEEALSAALEAARVKYMKSVKEPWVHELVEALVAERDEARREADDYLHELVDERARSDDAFKQQTALREAIMQSIDVERIGSAIRAALTDTAKAGAQYRRVPEGWTLKPEQPTDDMLSAGGKVQIYSPIVGHLGKKIALAVYGRMYAAAPQAGEPEGE